MIREAYFVDAGIWKAHFHSADQWHQITEAILREVAESRPALYTSDAVLLEFISLVRREGLDVYKIDQFVEAILQTAIVEYMHEQDLKRCRQVLLRYGNIGFSGVDAACIAVMDRLDIKKVLTVDEEFMKCNLFLEVRPNRPERNVVLR